MGHYISPKRIPFTPNYSCLFSQCTMTYSRSALIAFARLRLSHMNFLGSPQSSKQQAAVLMKAYLFLLSELSEDGCYLNYYFIDRKWRLRSSSLRQSEVGWRLPSCYSHLIVFCQLDAQNWRHFIWHTPDSGPLSKTFDEASYAQLISIYSTRASS